MTWSLILSVVIAVVLVLLVIAIKLFERQQLAKFKKIHKGTSGRRKNLPTGAPSTIPSRGIFHFPISILKKIIGPHKTPLKPGAIIAIEEYEKKPDRERVGIEHEFILNRNVVKVFDYDAISKVLLDHKTFSRVHPFPRGDDLVKPGETVSFEEFLKRKLQQMSGLVARLFGASNLTFLSGDSHKRMRDLLEPSFMDVSRFGKAFWDKFPDD